METLEEKIKRLENELVEVKEQLKQKEKNNKRWKPQEGESYFCVPIGGEVENCSWFNDNFDEWTYLTRNCFKTKEEAVEHKKKIEYQAQFRNYIEEHSKELDWNNDNQDKYYLYYGHKSKRILIASMWMSKNQGTIYASSEQILKDAIAEIGTDNVKKYILEV